MPIAKYKPSAQPQTKPNLPRTEPKVYKGVVVQDNITPVKSLMAYMDGAPWTVDYYSQVVKEHNNLREIDSASPDLLQQYQKIENFELRVSSALTDSYDPANGITSVTGNGLMVNVVVPNKLDYFTSDTGDSNTGLFKITNVERKTFNNDSVFYVEYELVGYIDAGQSKVQYETLESKTIRKYVFSKDRLVENLSPLLKEEDSEKILNLKNAYHGIVRYYFKTFFNRNYMTLVIPGQEVSIFDSGLVKYLLSLVDSFDAEEIRKIRVSTNDNDPYLAQPQFWDFMSEKDYDNLSECNKKMGLISRIGFNQNSSGKGFAFGNVDYIVYPMEADNSLKLSTDPDLKVLAIKELVATNNFKGQNSSLISKEYRTATKTYLLYPDVLVDDYYVLSQDFYDNTQNQTVIEILTKDYMKGQTIDLDMLYAVINSFHKWPRLEQFYYGPIILTLIKEADRSTY